MSKKDFFKAEEEMRSRYNKFPLKSLDTCWLYYYL